MEKAKGVSVYCTENTAPKLLFTVARPNILFACFSPQGSMLVTWETPGAEVKDNMFVYNSVGEQLYGTSQRKMSQDSFPSLKWTNDEAVCGVCCTNEILFFDGKTMAVLEPRRKWRLAGVNTFAWSPGPAPYKCAAFVAATAKAATMTIATFPTESLEGDWSSVYTCSRVVGFKASSVDLLWNSIGDGLLVSTHTETDSSGKSYYGETGVHLMVADGSHQEKLELKQEEPIHDVQWAPDGRSFTVIYGRMPAQASLFDFPATPSFNFGTYAWNTIKYSPHGRFIMLGGFGNLAGGMTFWDTQTKKKLGESQDTCTALEWSPDSRAIVCATCFPRLRVDNGYRIYNYCGELLHSEMEESKELYQVAWQQVKKGTFADRPPTPRKERRERMHADGGGAAKASMAVPAAPAAGKYIPPAARARMLAAGIDPDKQVKSVATISLHDHEKAENLKSGVTFSGEKLTASQIKNKKKKEKAVRDKEEAAAKEAEDAASKKAGKAAPAAAAAAGAGEKPIGDLTPEEKEKRIKKVTKQLRQIDQLKETQASGLTLESSQLEKLKGEEAIRAELKALSL